MVVQDPLSLLSLYADEARIALRVLVILTGTVVVARLFGGVLGRHFNRVSAEMAVSRTSRRLLQRMLTAGIYVVGIGLAVYSVPALRGLSVAMFASAGVIGIVIGFAAQQSVANIIAGVLIAVSEPFRVGDKIEAQTHYGMVEDITLRQTVINTPSNERVIVPNAKILDDYIVNYSIRDEKSRYPVRFTIAYRDDIDEARDIIIEEADAHPLTEQGESKVIVPDLGDNGVVLELRLWSHDRGDAWQAGQDLRESIKKRFDEESITIPFPQRTVHMDE